jgi:hypothetical protein
MSNNLSTDSFLQNSIDSVKIKETLFESERYSVNEQIPEYIVANVKSNTELFSFVDDYTRNMIMRLVHEVYIAKEEEVIQTPKTWWDMFKIAHFPEWAKTRFPPQFNTRTINKKILMVDGRKVENKTTMFREYSLGSPEKFQRPTPPPSRMFRG